jgi:hypothetical protein
MTVASLKDPYYTKEDTGMSFVVTGLILLLGGLLAVFIFSPEQRMANTGPYLPTVIGLDFLAAFIFVVLGARKLRSLRR